MFAQDVVGLVVLVVIVLLHLWQCGTEVEFTKGIDEEVVQGCVSVVVFQIVERMVERMVDDICEVLVYQFLNKVCMLLEWK
jgi:hypothetical protein